RSSQAGIRPTRAPGPLDPPGGADPERVSEVVRALPELEGAGHGDAVAADRDERPLAEAHVDVGAGDRHPRDRAPALPADELVARRRAPRAPVPRGRVVVVQPDLAAR